MSFVQLLNKFSRAALFGASMNDMGESLQYALLFSYLFIIPIGILLQNQPLLIAGLGLAIVRIIFATWFWWQMARKIRIFTEIVLSDIVFLYAYSRALMTRTLEWGGIRYRMEDDGRMVKL